MSRFLSVWLNYRCPFTCKVQDTAGGIDDVLLLADRFVHDDKMVVILGNNILATSISPYAAAFAHQKVVMVLL